MIVNTQVLEAGVDEAGRGSLIGRVYAAAVVWGNEPIEVFYDELASIQCHRLSCWDSKRMSGEKRVRLAKFIETHAMETAVGYAEPWEIDSMNILHATFLAMKRALDQLKLPIDHILVDGSQFKPYTSPETGDWVSHTCVPQGDGKYLSIGAASVLAKVCHDEHIRDLCKRDSCLNKRYDLLNNYGYGTKTHMNGLDAFGNSKWHRKTFKCCARVSLIKDDTCDTAMD